MKHRDKILELRTKGYSYRKIQDELGCSRSTISFHCGEGQKTKHAERRARFKENNVLLVKIYKFCEERSIKNNEYQSNKNIKYLLARRIYRFLYREDIMGNKSEVVNFSVDELLEKIGPDPRCSLTGRSINLDKPTTYQLDHIVPKSRGGKNTLDNCQLVCKEANRAKSDLLTDDFIKLCEDVVKHNKSKKKKSK